MGSSNRKRRKKLTKSSDGNFFHSKFEMNCYELLKEYLPTTEIELQKQYPYHKKYNKCNKKTCDFYFKYNEIPIWLEVSSYKSKRTAYRTNIKRTLIKQVYPNNIFVFIDSLKSLINILKQC